eukprot:TRINITY_DN0_c7_g2_i2.p1 TRINITY_DN0_c7_g2~~TRINITY_DN0_c7_g2_i2.p1  ORF type:complete len:112 (+),score=14.30 TRINITY_DN0_c7_g2_i2:75-410(+)
MSHVSQSYEHISRTISKFRHVFFKCGGESVVIRSYKWMNFVILQQAPFVTFQKNILICLFVFSHFQVADEHGLEFSAELETMGGAKQKVKKKEPVEQEDDLEARLKKLQGI